MIEEATRVGLNLNVRKCKTLRIEYAGNREHRDEWQGSRRCRGVGSSLEAIVDKEGGSNKDIKNRLQKARSAFQRLGKVCTAKEMGRKTRYAYSRPNFDRSRYMVAKCGRSQRPKNKN